MAIPNFFQQQQQSIKTGLGLGQAMVEAQQNALLNPLEVDLAQSRVEGQGIQNQLGQARLAGVQQQTEQKGKEDFKVGLRQDLGMLFAYNDDPELFDKAVVQIAQKYQSDPLMQPFFEQLMAEKDQNKRNSGLLGLISVLNPEQQRAKGRSTSAIENLKYYNELKKTDQEGAELFASSAALTTGKDGGKPRMFRAIKNDDGSITKIFTDGSEENIKSSKNIKTDDMKTSISYEKSLTVLDKAKDSQLKNGGFAITMSNGLATMDRLEAAGLDPSSIANVQRFLAGTTLGNIILNDDQQVYAGAIEGMINAIARRETGAAITKDETKKFFNRYMPVSGDTKNRIEQKKRKLESQFKSLRGQSGRVYDALRVTSGLDIDKPRQGSQQINNHETQQGIPKVGEVSQGYRFKGGNPADPNSWEKL